MNVTGASGDDDHGSFRRRFLKTSGSDMEKSSLSASTLKKERLGRKSESYESTWSSMHRVFLKGPETEKQFNEKPMTPSSK
ncbi:hypothetical protein Mapa_008228 [Marchantia paleacea]|nr:hypothetical protein Mapa_008228 [Marchantia paleacea]